MRVGRKSGLGRGTRSWLVLTGMLFVTVMAVGPGVAAGAPGRTGPSGPSAKRYQALPYAPPPSSTTWQILRRDGANRQVKPYLSSLGEGEAGTGVVVSPNFVVTVPAITFTICGHDGADGTHKKNFIALVDHVTGKTLRTTFAPRCDAMQQKAWDVRDLQGRKVHIEVHDGDSQRAFAWLGVGMVDAGPPLRVRFNRGMPNGWKAVPKKQTARTRLLEGGIPFLQLVTPYSMVPPSGTAEIPCGFTAKRLFFLGCTIADGQPLRVYGWIEIQYVSGKSERYPLRYGYTLDGEAKLLSPSPAIHLHVSGDPFQYYMVVRPRNETIRAIRLTKNPRRAGIPRITAITCETTAVGAPLQTLPDCQPGPREAAWIRSQAISARAPALAPIVEQIRRDHHLTLEEGPTVLRFARTRISDATFEAASVCDVNRDGKKDIISGQTWYQGPTFSRRHRVTNVARAGEYWDDFSDYPMDVNGDGYPDIITGAFFGGPLRWLENPAGGTRPWRVHPIAKVGPIETVRFWDIDGDGTVEVVPNAGGNVIFFRLVRDARGKATGMFTRHAVKLGGCGHGLGFGDINGDGRGDFVVPDGWIENPGDPLKGQWIWHDDGFRLGLASVPIIVHDVNQDGRADLIVGQAHDYGLDWYEQKAGHNGKRIWWKHAIDRGSSQYHDLALADIDRDGKQELVTGKRYRAHNGHDPGSTDPLFVRYFDIDKGRFTCHTIDYGPATKASGVGIYLWVDDVDGNGWPDIVAPGKEGLDLFRNLGH